LFSLLLLGFISGCSLAPGMHFAESDKPVDGALVRQVNVQGLQYRLRIVPISKKLLYLQNYSRNKANLTTKTINSSRGIFSSGYAYRVQPNDILGITLWESTDAVLPSVSNLDLEARPNAGNARAAQRNTSENSVTVDSDGYIYFPFAGEVHVKGLTASAIRREMQNKMKEYFDDPKISVRVLEHNSQFAMVTGKVGTPGRIPITSRSITVVDAIHSTGGLQDDGSWKHATLTRLNGQKITIDLHKIYTGGNLSQNYRLRHGDILHVPFVEGQTAYLYSDSGAKPMLLQNNTVSLTEAIGDAGGITGEAANSREIFILRKENGRPFDEITAYHINLRSPAALVMANSFFLKPKDIVYIETSNIIRWNRAVSLLLSLQSAPVELQNLATN